MTNSTSNFIDVRSDVGASGQFINCLRNGRYSVVSELVQDRLRLSQELAELKGKLRGCNSWATLGEFAHRHRIGPQDTVTKLRTLVTDLETRKSDLVAKLGAVDAQLAREGVVGEWETIPSPPMCLIPRVVRVPDESVAERNKIIDANSRFSDQRICKLLDEHFSCNGDEPCYHLPKGWMKAFGVETFCAAYLHTKCRNRIQPMISKRRRIVGHLKA